MKHRRSLSEGDIHLIKTLGDRVLHQDLAACLGIDVEYVTWIFKKAVTSQVSTRRGIRVQRLKPKP